MTEHTASDARSVPLLVNAGAWIAAGVMLIGLAALGAWGILFDTGRGVSNDRPIGLVPRLFARGQS